jgi:hypothetical protein
MVGAGLLGGLIWNALVEPSAKPHPSKPIPIGAAMAPGSTIDLFQYVDPVRDGLWGKWSVTKDGLYVAPGTDGPYPLAIPFLAPAEFDYEIEYTVDPDGIGTVNQFFEVNHRLLEWTVNAHPKAIKPFNGFPRLDGHDLVYTPEVYDRSQSFPNGVRYRSLVQVRKNSMTGIVNGRTLLRWEGDLTRFAPATAFRIPADRIALMCWHGGVTFHSAKVRRLKSTQSLCLSDVVLSLIN